MNCERNVAAGRITSYTPVRTRRYHKDQAPPSTCCIQAPSQPLSELPGVEKLVMVCWTPSTRMAKFGFFRPVTIWPLLLVIERPHQRSLPGVVMARSIDVLRFGRHNVGRKQVRSAFFSPSLVSIGLLIFLLRFEVGGWRRDCERTNCGVCCPTKVERQEPRQRYG